MTLLEAYSDQKDFDYYKKFCKEDVATMVSFKPPFKVFRAVCVILDALLYPIKHSLVS